MELPHVGIHCHDKTCNVLDFLPYECPFCKKTFCQQHFKAANDLQNEVYNTYPKNTISVTPGHICPDKPMDVRATTCPVCSRVVPINRGADPNVAVNDHINAGCPDPGTSTSEKAYTNPCSMQGCSKKELVPILCQKCLKPFCIRHRLEADHKCSIAGSTPPAQKNRQSSAKTKMVSAAARQNTRGEQAAQLDKDRRDRAYRATQIRQDAALAQELQNSEQGLDKSSSSFTSQSSTNGNQCILS
ncbi:zinc finger, AN1-type domain [Batrachochytrium dendrobatidis]|nr:zinc finger, AN1-type domain [Batrachochytrium dendrobatidis]